MTDPTRRFELAVPSTPASLSLLRANVGWLCERGGLHAADASRFVLAAVEAATNIIRHAYRGDPRQTIVLRGVELDDGVELEFLDRGHCVDPGALLEPAPDAEKLTTDGQLRPGGLGLHLIRSAVDEVIYEERSDGSGARLVLRKHRSSAAPPCETPDAAHAAPSEDERHGQ